MGIEALAFCSLLVVVLIVGGLVSLYEALSSSWPPPAPSSSTQVTVWVELSLAELLLTVMICSKRRVKT